MKPLEGTRVVSLAVNVPGPVAAARLRELGAAVAKVEPPGGDPLALACLAWYEELCRGQEVRRLDLKAPHGRAELDQLLAEADLLLTSSRPSALSGLGLDWPALHARHPRVAHVAIVGYAAPRGNAPGHDLTYLAEQGLVVPPHLPPTLMADLAGAERAVSAALALLLARGRDQEAGYAEVALTDVAASLAAPLRHGLTLPGGLLGGGFAGYNVYATRRGWIALGAIEPHFWQRVQRELGLNAATYDDLAAALVNRDADEWAAWGAERDLPIVVVREGPWTD